MLHITYKAGDADWNDRVRATKDKYRAALTEFVRVYHCTRNNGNSPAECARRLFAEYDDTPVAVVATLVNAAAWDGRISPNNARWAAAYPAALDEETALRFDIYTNEVHRAHLDQIATECRKLCRA